MYRGEDIAVLASHLAIGRLDAVWGSRRLSARDIAESIRFRYQKTPLFGAISAVGSHVLSLACLFLYGRYISDTLSAVRVVRSEDALRLSVPLTHKHANEHLLARLLRRKAELLEIPVQFFPISPERVKRTSVGEGLRSLATLIAGRLTAGARPGSDRAATPPPRTGGRLLSPRGEGQPILIVPAAGAGSRLQTSTPKFLVPVNGRPMIDRLIDLYRPHVSRIVLVVNPAFEAEARARSGGSGRADRRRGPGAADRHARRRAEGPRDRRAFVSAARVGHLVRSGRDSSADHRHPLGALHEAGRRADRHADAAAIQSVYSFPARRRRAHRQGPAAARGRHDARSRRERRGSVQFLARRVSDGAAAVCRVPRDGERDQRTKSPAVHPVDGGTLGGRRLSVRRRHGSRRHQHAGGTESRRGLPRPAPAARCCRL